MLHNMLTLEKGNLEKGCVYSLPLKKDTLRKDVPFVKRVLAQQPKLGKKNNCIALAQSFLNSLSGMMSLF